MTTDSRNLSNPSSSRVFDADGMSVTSSDSMEHLSDMDWDASSACSVHSSMDDGLSQSSVIESDGDSPSLSRSASTSSLSSCSSYSDSSLSNAPVNPRIPPYENPKPMSPIVPHSPVGDNSGSAILESLTPEDEAEAPEDEAEVILDRESLYSCPPFSSSIVNSMVAEVTDIMEQMSDSSEPEEDYIPCMPLSTLITEKDRTLTFFCKVDSLISPEEFHKALSSHSFLVYDSLKIVTPSPTCWKISILTKTDGEAKKVRVTKVKGYHKNNGRNLRRPFKTFQHTLTIGTLNIRSSRDKINFTAGLMDSYSMDFLALQETHCDGSTPPLAYDGLFFTENKPPKARASLVGVAAISREETRLNLTFEGTPNLALQLVYESNNRPIIFGSIYIPSVGTDIRARCIKQVTDRLIDLYRDYPSVPIIIAGDFNTHPNRLRATFKDILKYYSIHFLPFKSW